MRKLTAWFEREHWWQLLALLLAIGLAEPFVDWLVMP